ncbi:MAG: hypothetical protein COB50_00910 [Thiotrichales bacterium]|nr:MAG: hypothetical protein COB50_00910 [Thiotrichales bacterium]
MKHHQEYLLVKYANTSLRSQAIHLAEIFKAPCCGEDEVEKHLTISTNFILCVETYGLTLQSLSVNLQLTKPIYIDFTSGKALYRYQSNTKKPKLISALGIKNREKVRVLDATVGLGNDSLVMANYGFAVTAIERNHIVYLLLKDALLRATGHEVVGQTVSRITLLHGDASDHIPKLAAFAVIYIDCMFPKKTSKKTALVKKEMRVLREIVGEDQDAETLLTIALHHATSRVVVKRHIRDPHILQKPDIQFVDASVRYDVYLAVELGR